MKYIRRFDESYGYDPTDGMVFYEDKDWAKIEDFRWRILDYLESNNYPVKHKIKNFGDNKIQMLHITSTNYMFIKTLSGPRLKLTPMEIAKYSLIIHLTIILIWVIRIIVINLSE